MICFKQLIVWYLLTGTACSSEAVLYKMVGAAQQLSAEVIETPGDEYGDSVRVWQGIPGIERASNGRLWAAWYSGGTGEGRDGNYVLVATSNDDGLSWSDPVVVIKGPTDQSRIGDPLPWIDPTGKLWIFYRQVTPAEEGVVGFFGTCAICTDSPEEADPDWTRPVFIYGGGTLFGKPLVRSDGAWVAPFFLHTTNPEIKETCTLISTDKGEDWNYLGGTTVPAEERSYSEATLAQRDDGTLWMVIRRVDGLSQSFSSDNGKTWTAPSFLWEGPSTRGCMRKLASGSYMLVYHDVTERISNGQYPRSRLTVWLSEDEGETWPYKLLLDEWVRVSYPDSVQAPDGRIYIVYDFDRYHFVDEDQGKEVRLAIIQEDDIRAGDIVSLNSRLKLTVNQALGSGNERE